MSNKPISCVEKTDALALPQLPYTAPLICSAQHVSHTHQDVIQVANCSCWQRDPRKSHKCCLGKNIEDIREVLSSLVLLFGGKEKWLPMMSLLKHLSACVCKRDRICVWITMQSLVGLATITADFPFHCSPRYCFAAARKHFKRCWKACKEMTTMRNYILC